MTYNNPYTLNVDLKHAMTSVIPVFKQGETAKLRFRLFDNGHHLDTTPYTYSEVVHVLPSGDRVMGTLDLITVDGEDLLEYVYTGMEMAEIGKVKVQLVIQSANTNVAIRPFKVEIVEDFHTGELTYVGILQELITEVSLLKEEMYKAINSWRFIGSYDNATQYYKHNVIEYQGSSWISLRDTLGNVPPTLPIISDLNWHIVARKADGEGTVKSVNGVSPDSTGNVTLNSNNIGAISQYDFNNHVNKQATTSQYGHTKLNNTLTSTSVEEASTANTVKQLNDKITDLTTKLNQMGRVTNVYKSNDQTVTSDNRINILWDYTLDNPNLAVVENNKIIIKEAGLYDIRVKIGITPESGGTSTGYRELTIYRDNSAHASRVYALPNNTTIIEGNKLLAFQVNEELPINILQTSGTSLTIPLTFCFVTIRKITV